ncbi:GntR family transcriptional regulator [Kineococcus sp. NUM-3379]
MSASRHLTDGVVPKHEQLRTILADLATRAMAPGDMLPSERQLCAEYGVSRITVREAVGQLVSEGLLTRRPGKGTFVAARAVRSRLHLASFHEDMRRMGLEPSTEVLAVEHEVPPARTAGLLRLPATARAYRVRRLRLADGRPMSVDDAWYSAALLPGLDRLDLTGSVYDLLERHFGCPVDSAEQTVGAALAGPGTGRLLGIPETGPVLAFDRVASSGGRPLEHARSLYRGDRYELTMRVEEPASAGHRRG